MVNSVIGGFQKISKRRNRSHDEMELVHSKRYKKPKRIDKRSPYKSIVEKDPQGMYEDEVQNDFEY